MKIVRTPTRVTGGSMDHVARYMLAGPPTLIVVGMMVAFALI